MQSSNERSEKFYWLKLRKNIAKTGKVYWTGNFSYAIDIVGFEKDDGTMTMWFNPKDMDQMKQRPQQQVREAPPKQAPPTQKQYAPSSPQHDETPWPEDEIPF